MFLLAIVTACAPWIIGVIASQKVSSRLSNSIALPFITAGVGGAIGLFLFAFLLTQAADNGFDLYPSPQIVLILGLVTVVFAGIFFINSLRSISGAIAVKKALAISVLVSLLFFSLVYNAINVPLHGWDTLGHWAHQAVRVLEGINEQQVAVDIEHRHPSTLIFLYSWFSWCIPDSGISSIGVLYSLFMLSYLFFLFGFAFEITGKISIALITCYLAMSVPLTENHWTVSGYPDILVGLWVAVGTGLSVIGIRNREFVISILGVGALLLPVTIKNTGFGVSLAAIIAVLAGTFLNPRAVILGLTALLIFAFALIAVIYFDETVLVEFVNSRTPSEHGFQISLGGWTYGIDISGLGSLGGAIKEALFVNLSFSTIFLLLPIAYYLEISNANSSVPIAGVVLLVTVFVALIPNLALISGFRFDYLLDGDVGYSRFSLWYVVSLPLLFPLAVCAVNGGKLSSPNRGPVPPKTGAANF